MNKALTDNYMKVVESLSYRYDPAERLGLLLPILFQRADLDDVLASLTTLIEVTTCVVADQLGCDRDDIRADVALAMREFADSQNDVVELFKRTFKTVDL